MSPRPALPCADAPPPAARTPAPTLSQRPASGRRLAWLCALTLAGACGGAEDPAQAEAAAHAIWTERCVNCHGPEGRGDGPTGKTLFPPPRSFHDREWQARVRDAEIEAVIVHGGRAIGRSVGMPPNIDLRTRPRVVEALVRMIRTWPTEPTVSAPP